MKIVVYKAVFRPPGDDLYDVLYPPPASALSPAVEFILFRDVPAPTTDQGWTVLPQVFADRDLRRRARHHKCRPDLLFPDADWSLWLDGSLTPRVPPAEIVAAATADFNTFDRIKRRCAYAEARAMAAKRRDDPGVIADQTYRMRRAGFPRDQGLCATTAVLRRHTPAVARVNESWWDEIARGSNRDQVSINFVLWQHGLEWGRLAGRWNHSPLFTWRPHYARTPTP